MTATLAAANLAVVRADGAFALRTEPLRPLGPHDVRFRVLCAAVCGTDRQIARGDRPDRATVLGHEGVAAVAATGAAVRAFAPGERVVFDPVNPADQDEILGHSTPGVFQRVFDVTAPELARRALVERVPAGLDAGRAVLAEPLGTVVYTHELLHAAGAPRSLWILGAGPIGILHALWAERVAGVPDVRLVCNGAARARWLAGRSPLLGTRVVAWDEPAGERLLAAHGAARADAVLVCTPARATPAALAAALALVGDDGIVGVIGGAGRAHLDALPGVDLVALRRANVCGRGAGTTAAVTAAGRRVRLFGQRGTHGRHLQAAMAALQRDAAFASILTHRVSLPALPDALSRIAAGLPLAGAHCVKALVDCSAERALVEPLDGAAPDGGDA